MGLIETRRAREARELARRFAAVAALAVASWLLAALLAACGAF